MCYKVLVVLMDLIVDVSTNLLMKCISMYF